MHYVQFFQRSATSDALIEACGDRGVIILDGRCSRDWMNSTASDECVRRGYLAWQLYKGETFTRSAPIGPVVEHYTNV
jgi:hypothetical protein